MKAVTQEKIPSSLIGNLLGFRLIPNKIPTSVKVGKVRLFPMSFLLGITDSQCWKFVQFPNWVLMFYLWDFIGNLEKIPNLFSTISQRWDKTKVKLFPVSLVGYFGVPRQIPDWVLIFLSGNFLGNL